MNDQSPSDIWERRYRDLEKQLEYLLINVAESMASLENKSHSARKVTTKMQGFEPRIVKVVKATNPEFSYIYCVANGVNMEYRFEIFNNKVRVQDTGFSRLNSVKIDLENHGLVDLCRVTVRADFGKKRRDLVAQTDIKWNEK